MGTCVHFSRSLPSNSWWQTMVGCQVLSRPSAAEGGGRRPAFTGPATQPYSATEVDGWNSSAGCLKTGPQYKGQTEALWYEDPAQISAVRCQVDGTACQPCLRRARRQDPLSRVRPVVAPGGAACALRGRYSSNQGGVPADEYGPVARCHRHHSHLWPSFQDRTHVQAGCASNRLIRLPFLDDGHDPVAIPEREPAPSSPVGSLPRTNPPQNPCLSCLHAGWCHRAGPATVSLGRVSKAGLGLVRFLAQNHSSRHSTIGICRWQCDAPDDSRFSRKLCKNQFSCRIHHRPARYRQYEGIPPGFINEKFVFQDKSHPDSAPSTGGSQQLCALQNGGELVTLELLT